jgi:hypothetical protein
MARPCCDCRPCDGNGFPCDPDSKDGDVCCSFCACHPDCTEDD